MYRRWPFGSDKPRTILFNEFNDCRIARDNWTVVYSVAVLAFIAFSATMLHGYLYDYPDWVWMVPDLGSLYILFKAVRKVKTNSKVVDTYYKQRSEEHKGDVDHLPMSY